MLSQSPEKDRRFLSKSASKVYKHGFNMHQCALIHYLLDIVKDFESESFFLPFNVSDE